MHSLWPRSKQACRICPASATRQYTRLAIPHRMLYTHKVEYFSLYNEMVQPVHDFFDARHVVPPVYVKDVDIRRAQLLERCFKRNAHRLGRVSDIADLLLDRIVGSLELGRILYAC